MENYEAWKVELEELLGLGEEMVSESEILEEESFDFVRTLHSRLDLTLEVTKQLVGTLHEKVNTIKYYFNLYKSFVTKISWADPLSTDTCTLEDFVLGKFDEMESPEGIDGAQMTRLTRMVLSGHDAAKMADEFKGSVPDLVEQIEVAKYRRAGLRDIDEDGISRLLQAFNDNKQQ